ncbi:Hypothetical_protein [Hexamita inflata]|uniref:Hypothetical_protein n=1 Tax=Hexamita inflata TaxID=28002 RepID=A0AA86NQS1_9EUKA|nr:Hypothetical protein HINF_LOCUS11464 [Hexamita inflata]
MKQILTPDEIRARYAPQPKYIKKLCSALSGQQDALPTKFNNPHEVPETEMRQRLRDMVGVLDQIEMDKLVRQLYTRPKMCSVQKLVDLVGKSESSPAIQLSPAEQTAFQIINSKLSDYKHKSNLFEQIDAHKNASISSADFELFLRSQGISPEIVPSEQLNQLFSKFSSGQQMKNSDFQKMLEYQPSYNSYRQLGQHVNSCTVESTSEYKPKYNSQELQNALVYKLKENINRKFKSEYSAFKSIDGDVRSFITRMLPEINQQERDLLLNNITHTKQKTIPCTENARMQSPDFTMQDFQRFIGQDFDNKQSLEKTYQTYINQVYEQDRKGKYPEIVQEPVKEEEPLAQVQEHQQEQNLDEIHVEKLSQSNFSNNSMEKFTDSFCDAANLSQRIKFFNQQSQISLGDYKSEPRSKSVIVKAKRAPESTRYPSTLINDLELLNLKNKLMSAFNKKKRNVAHSLLLCEEAAMNDKSVLKRMYQTLGDRTLTQQDVNLLLKATQNGVGNFLKDIKLEVERNEVETDLAFFKRTKQNIEQNLNKVSQDVPGIPYEAETRAEQILKPVQTGKRNASNGVSLSITGDPEFFEEYNNKSRLKWSGYFEQIKENNKFEVKKAVKGPDFTLSRIHLNDFEPVEKKINKETTWGKSMKHSELFNQPADGVRVNESFQKSVISEYLKEGK